MAAQLPSGEIFAAHWGAQARLRLGFFFAVAGWVFFSGAGKEGGDGVRNSVVFTWAFVEVLGWFWVSEGFFRGGRGEGRKGVFC